MADSINVDKPLINSAVHWLNPQNWECRWGGGLQVIPSTNTAVCLLPTSSNTDCTCDSMPAPFSERLSRQEQIGALTPMAFSTVSSTCEQGVLLGGTCLIDRSDTTGAIWETSLASAGPLDFDTWGCSWKNPTDTALAASATAVCLLPDPAEITPLADRIVRVERSGQLPANNLYVEAAMCELGDFLLWGSCALDNPDPSLSDVFMFRSGFVDPTSNAWQCGWYNPTDLTPTVTATALCLKP
jgi:hypothetical protein